MPAFVQSGYQVLFFSSHDTEVSCTHEGTKSAAINLTVPKRRSIYCIDKSGSYICKLKSCHVYESNIISFTTRRNEVYISAKKHSLAFKIEINKPANDIVLNVNIDGIRTEKGPLKCINNACPIELFMNEEESAVVVPHSEILYFKPPIISINGKDDCANIGTIFHGIEGKVFQGKVIPPLAGVLITLETEKEALLAETDSAGQYKFQPQDATKTYRISAKKESFVLIGPDDSGNFLAHKLAEIIVQVFDSRTRLPLQVINE